MELSEIPQHNSFDVESGVEECREYLKLYKKSLTHSDLVSAKSRSEEIEIQNTGRKFIVLF